MQTQTFFGVENAYKATGFVVVIDVLRAATTAASALARGAKEIIPVASIDEAYAYKELHPDVLLMGENRGELIPRFDFGNSPYFISTAEISGKTLVHRSTEGTQGIVRATQATTLVFGGFVTAHAIYSFVQEMQPEVVSFVALAGVGTEDALFAEYMDDLLHGKQTAMRRIIEQVKMSSGATGYFDAKKAAFPEQDFTFCFDTDRFSFAVVAVREPYLHLVKKII